MNERCDGCVFLRFEERPHGLLAARCANHAPTGGAIRGFGRTLEVFRTGEPGPVLRPVWCRGERKRTATPSVASVSTGASKLGMSHAARASECSLREGAYKEG